MKYMKLSGRQRKLTADARSKQLRRRLYRGAAITTFVYVVLSIVNFLFQLTSIPYELAIIWAVVIICYATFREALRWNNIDDTNYPGEFWAGFVVAGAVFMIAWNIGRQWIFRLPYFIFPQEYEAAVIETIVLYTLSGISSFIHERKRTRVKSRHRTHPKNILEEKQFAFSPQASPATGPELNSEVKATLVSAKTLDSKKEEKSSI
jgi:amino acid permease